MFGSRDSGKGATPETVGKKSDHFVGDYYVLFNKMATDDQTWNEKAQDLLRKWEAGDQETVTLWRKMNRWAFDGFRETYELFGIHFDKEYYESDIYKMGKEIVAEGLQKGVFRKRADGAVVVDIETDSGEKVLLRPIRPEDEPAHVDFVNNVSAEDYRLRFFSPMRSLPHTEMARFTQIDYDREMVFVAEMPHGVIGGVVRLVLDPNFDSAECAIIVRSDLQRHGIGRTLLREALGYARSRGANRVWGDILHGNERAVALARKLGAQVGASPVDPALVRTEFKL
jgi:RimJ/RimL family protein N-acetyltransferase